MARRKARPQPQAKYDAAGTGRRVAAWRPPSSGPNRALQGLQNIRNRARDVARNDWAGESALQKWTTNLVGTGIVPRWADDGVTDRFKKWVPIADADGVLDYYGLQTLVTRSWLDGGECFGRRRPRLYVTRDAAPMQIQLLEAEFCPLFDSDQWQGMPAGNTIRQGIERNKRGERVAFWMYREHPGDGVAGTTPTIEQLVRVPARDIIHVFEPKRPGQLRGVSQLAPVLVRLRASMDFEDAVLDRQKLANLFTMFITQQMPPDTAEIDYDPLTGLPTFYDGEGKALVGLEPGISQKLNPGEDVKFTNPPEAGTTYSDYLRSTHLGTASGSGLPYELFSGDLKDVSDRTLRVIINEFRRFAKQRQWQILIPQFCQRAVEWWAEADALGGGLSLAQVETAKAPTWSPHGWEYIHPTQDAEGKKIEVEAGFRSRSDVIGERGDDPVEVDEQRAADLKRSKSMGLEPPPKAPKAPKQPTALERDMHALAMRQGEAAIRASERPAPDYGPALTAIAGAVAAMASRPADPPTINIDNHTHAHVEPTPVEVNVEPAPVHVDNTVNVEPAPVHVDNTVNVEQAPVEVTVELPNRQTTSVIERDEKGGIVNVTQTETTIQ